MSVRQSLLAILDQGPCYGYQLRHEFERRTGGVWPLNVGQIYNTLERLERDGLAARGEADTHGHVYWRITDAGSDEVASWLSSPVPRASSSRDDLAMKLAVTATLPGVDAVAAIRAQREISGAHVSALRALAREDAGVDDAEALAHMLVVDAMIFSAEAEVRWLEHVERLLAERSDRAMPLELTTERPKRGRPAQPRTPAVA